jgi:hypothetical protein
MQSVHHLPPQPPAATTHTTHTTTYCHNYLPPAPAATTCLQNPRLPPSSPHSVLHLHCVGFHKAVAHACLGARHQEELLAAVWQGYVQLWDEALGVGACCGLERPVHSSCLAG